MKFELLLNVNLTWQLLLKQLILFLRQLDHVMRVCSRCRVKGEAGSACRLGQVLHTCSRPYIIRCEGGLDGQIGWDGGVGQGGAWSGSCRKRNRESKQDKHNRETKCVNCVVSAVCMQ